jgi:type II secretory pathway pseudopilin PulG
MYRLKALTRSGDTIVEVMIVLAVLGMAISISYATANRSLLNARQAQENSEASALVRSQLESLRVLAPNMSSPPLTDQQVYRTRPFCVVTDGTKASGYRVIETPVSNIVPAECSSGSVPYEIQVVNCRVGNTPAPSPFYDACLGHTTDDTFVARAIWPNVRGEGDDTVMMTVRVHEPTPIGSITP